MNYVSNLSRDEILTFLKEYKCGNKKEWFDRLLCKFKDMFGENREIIFVSSCFNDHA